MRSTKRMQQQHEPWLIFTSKQTALGCSYKQNGGMSRRNYHKHDPAPLSLYNRGTTASGYISDRKNRGSEKSRKTAARRVPCLDKQVLARGGGGGTCPPPPFKEHSPPTPPPQGGPYYRPRTRWGTSENEITKHQMTCARAGAPVERMDITLVPGVRHGCAIGCHLRESDPKCPAEVQGTQVAVPHNAVTLKTTQ